MDNHNKKIIENAFEKILKGLEDNVDKNGVDMPQLEKVYYKN